MKNILVVLTFIISITSIAQHDNSLGIYRGEETKLHDLIHTKLKVSFDFEKKQLNGEAWITATPHFYSKQDFTLDAKAMLIHEVKMGSKDLQYEYKNNILTIHLGNAYAKGETFEVYINYTARPEEVKQKGSAVISEAKGLYFIDADGTDPTKPTQVWTQGATESSSCWFPTIDSPNQKTTQEIYMTVPSRFTTLSNGSLISQTELPGDLRTDYWKMDQPHAPYLFFMGLGEYSLIKDSWNGKEVNYYVEKEYEKEAQAIFGLTPEMIQFFSDKFGVVYPWEKYSQIVGCDYISGAMENTTATIHSEPAYQKAEQLIDENTWEDVVSHELVHQWFGDLVTCESWSNITVNESFATYGEYLWREFKYGKDHADAHLFEDKTDYLTRGLEDKNLVRFHYADREDVFDGVSYQKGANILHMLRNYIGDKAFFAGLKLYLTKYQYQATEAHQLRLALEEVSGVDLNPFFNQWYYANGHPNLEISYDYSDDKSVGVKVVQTGKVFSFPLAIAIYENGKVLNHKVNITKREHYFSFKTDKKPDLVNVNADYVLLCSITDNQKTLENYIFQYHNAPHYLDRRNAIEELALHQDNKEVNKTLLKALDDSYYGLRMMALRAIDINKNPKALPIIEQLANSDPRTIVQGVALGILRKTGDHKYKSIFEKALNSPSYSVKENAILGLYKIDKAIALQAVNDLDKDAAEFLATSFAPIYIAEEDESLMPFIAKGLMQTMFKENATQKDQQQFMQTFGWIAKSDNKLAYQNLVGDMVSKGKKYKKYDIDKIAINLMTQMISLQKESNNANKQALILIVKKGLVALVE